jgi:hypothetical protein
MIQFVPSAEESLRLRTYVVVALMWADVSKRFLLQYVAAVAMCLFSLWLAYVDDFPRCLTYWLVGMTYLLDQQTRWVVVADVLHTWFTHH